MRGTVGADHSESRCDVLVVVGEIGDVTGSLAGSQATTVFTKVDGVKPGAGSVPVFGELGLEEIVRPACT
jgi:hypothetical protein